MLGPISNVTNKPIARTNLINFFRRNLVNATELEQIMHQYPSTCRDVGSLPTSWLRNMKKSEISEKTRQIQDAFANFSKQTTPVRPDIKPNFLNKIFNNNPVQQKTKYFQKKLISKLKKATGINDFKMHYISSGDIGKCFKINDGKYEYALKTFHEYEDFERMNGKFVEVQNALFANHNSPSGRFSKFFTGRFSIDDEVNDGYLLNKFITPQNAKPLGNNVFVSPTHYNYVRAEGFMHNYINGTAFDFGGITINEALRDAKVRRIYQALIKACENPSQRKTRKVIETFGKHPSFVKAKELLDATYSGKSPLTLP